MHACMEMSRLEQFRKKDSMQYQVKNKRTNIPNFLLRMFFLLSKILSSLMERWFRGQFVRVLMLLKLGRIRLLLKAIRHALLHVIILSSVVDPSRCVRRLVTIK